jgi:hypothetical protein
MFGAYGEDKAWAYNDEGLVVSDSSYAGPDRTVIGAASQSLQNVRKLPKKSIKKA